MTGELVPSAPDPWERLETESTTEYMAFSQFCQLGPKRSLRLIAGNLGISLETIKGYSRKNQWIARSKALDIASSEIIAGQIDMSPTETMAHQFAVGKAMLELGIQAINLKKPGTIKVSDAIKLIDKGSELQRKAQGLDGPNVMVSFNGKGFESVEQMLKEEIEGYVVRDETEED